MSGLFQPEFLSQVALAKETYAKQVQGHAVSFTAFRQAPWYQYGLLALEQTQLTLRSPFLDNDLVRTAFRAPNSAIAKSDIFEDNEDCARLIADGNGHLRQLRTDRGLGGAPGSWSAPIVRSYLEFTFRAEYAYDHYRVWYRDALAPYVREMLLDSRTLSRPYIQRNVLESLVQQHVKGEANFTTEIHRLLTLELQHRVFLDGQ
jgi:asparagine synthase (glutamine-hydrolysing)